MRIMRAWQRISPEVTVTGLSAVYLKEWMGLIMKYCGMTVKRMGMLGV